MGQLGPEAKYPTALLDWAGHRSGGVRRLFYEASGRPAGAVIRTRLLDLLEDWAGSVAKGRSGVPRVVLLVGGPGNGKTEAIEFTICKLDEALGLSGSLVSLLRDQFLARDGRPAPRLATIDLANLSGGTHAFGLSIVQDASVSDPERPETPAALLVQELEDLLAQRPNDVYLACINRGVLDDALIAATDAKRARPMGLLESIVRSVALSPDAPPCWPLRDHPSVAVWPMDVETLVDDGQPESQDPSAALQLLTIATNPARWPDAGQCPAGDRCPFCLSRSLVSDEPHGPSLLRILRWYELASGKRWSFRDLFSLISYLLAGVPPDDAKASYSPCDWAARLRELGEKASGRDSLRFSAPYLLVAAQYQHALFGHWPQAGLRSLRRDLHDLQLQDNPTLMGLYYFLSSSRGRSVPPTLESQLAGLSELLDPGVADPDMKVEVSGRSTITFREIDIRFSQSVGEGFQFIQKYKCLTPLESDLLRRLDAADQRLSDGDVVRRRPAVAARVQALVRDFSCRLVRRSIGVRSAVVRDANFLADFRMVVRGDEQLLHASAKQVEALLNEKERFVVPLNTTFGEPLPPVQRRAVLTTQKQKVKPLVDPEGTRPRGAIRFLGIGSRTNGKSIPLTYELFKSVRELRRGMIPASLPRTVVALLDTTRARLSGQIVRNEELLEGAEIRIGVHDDVIVRELGKFIVRRGDAE